MTTPGERETDTLLERASTGDQSAVVELFSVHRPRLRQMVAVRMDPRLNARVDPSDVVQDILMEASRAFEDFVRDRPLPFYAWLRQLAWQRLYDLHVRHVRSQKRSTAREAAGGGTGLSDESVMELARQVVASGTSPSMHVFRKELRYRVQNALSQMSDLDREVLVMRHLEQLSAKEIAAIIDVSESAVNMRHLRALRRLRGLLQDALGEC
jgi:RNA polymerase sigma-70 factor (ECF subfamily)